MNYGPVLSSLYDLIKGQPIDDALSLWSKFIARSSEHRVSLLNDPGDAELCQAEEEIIQEVYQAFGHLDPFLVAEWTHDLPEWQDPHGSAIPIAVEDILRNLGKSDQEISEIRQEAIREAYLDAVLNG